jgi:hypothetical protein
MPQQRVLVVYEKASESRHETRLPPKEYPAMSKGQAQQIQRGLAPTVGCTIISVTLEDSEPE